MDKEKRFRKVPFGRGRKMVAASLKAATRKKVIHFNTEVDISAVRRAIADRKAEGGEKLSLTGWVVFCLGQTLEEFPEFNSFRKGRHLIVLGEKTVNVLFEKEYGGERMPESIGFRGVERMSYPEISRKIREVQNRVGGNLGGESGAAWIRFIPGFLLNLMVRLASRSIAMQERYGVAAVTAVGMFGSSAVWAQPVTSATVTVAVGSIVRRLTLQNGIPEEREHLCLTLSFDHEIIDGAPAARFIKRFSEILSSAEKME